MDGDPSCAPLSARFDRALTFAAQLHADQRRKGSAVPYIAHLLAVTSIVLDVGGTEDEAIAALLHDAVEDQGGARIAERIHALFGDRVAAIVAGCTEIQDHPKPPWRARKEAYLAHLAHADPSVQLVALADKLHNARTTLRSYQREGDAVWRRFNAPREEQLWWYEALLEVFDRVNAQPQLVSELRDVVAALAAAVRSSDDAALATAERSSDDAALATAVRSSDDATAVRSSDDAAAQLL